MPARLFGVPGAGLGCGDFVHDRRHLGRSRVHVPSEQRRRIGHVISARRAWAPACFAARRNTVLDFAFFAIGRGVRSRAMVGTAARCGGGLG